MKSTIMKIIMLIAVFLLAFPACNTKATENLSNITEEDIKRIQDNTGVFESVATSFFLDIGDYAQDFLNRVFREEITIDKIVYNKAVLLNANFFNKSINKSVSNASYILREIITKWFEYFRKLALIVILCSLILAGIRIMLQTPNSRVKALDIGKRVVMAIALIYFFPYAMRLAFDLNEAIISYISSRYSSSDSIALANISQVTDLAEGDLEFRSPKYVTLQGLKVGAGSTEATQLYLNKLEDYRGRLDVMRMMRAFAGVTLRFAYIIIWYIMLAQTYILAVIYLKRYITIAFLLIIYPLVVIGYTTGWMFGGRQNSFNDWCKKFFSNIFLQTIHAIMYGTISGIIMSQVRSQFKGQNINVILLIIATSFLFSGEKLITRLWKLSVDTSEREGLRGIFKKPRSIINKLKG